MQLFDFQLETKKLISIFFFFFSFSLQIFAQNSECQTKVKKKATELYDRAEKITNIRPKDAVELLNQAIKVSPEYIEAHFLCGETLFQMATKIENDTSQANSLLRNAAEYFDKVSKICPKFNKYESTFYSGKCFYLLRNFEKSKEYFENFLSKTDSTNQHFDETNAFIANISIYLQMFNNPVPYNPVPIDSVSTNLDEFLPLISSDGELIFFTRRFINKDNKSVEELFYAKKVNADDTLREIFSEGKKMPPPFNEGKNQGGLTLTVDNAHLFITLCDYERNFYTSYKNCDIYSSDYIDNRWSFLKRLGTNINGNNSFEGQPSVTAEGNVLYFASAREGGYGGIDIYRSEKDTNTGEWKKAENLGPTINTTGDDKTPFIHSDSQTLYFASNGHFGMGGFDIFCSKYLGNGQWEKPKNLGYPINTGGDEVAFIISTNGKKIYFSNNILRRKAQNDWDIYSTELPEGSRPKKVVLLKGQLTDKRGNILQNASVELKSLQTQEKKDGIVDKKTGKYAIVSVVRKDEEFIMTIKKKGYVYAQQHIKPSDKKFDPPTTINISLDSIKVNEPFIIKNVNFATNSAELTAESIISLNFLVEFLRDNPKIEIEIDGHTDNIGDDTSNISLSIRRARSVLEYLVSQKISENRLIHKGFGEEQPLTTNETEEGKAMNRRVEFIIRKIK